MRPRVVTAVGKSRGRRQQHGHPLILASRVGAHPVVGHLVARICHQPLARVGYVILTAVPAYPVKHHEVVLVPVQYARQGRHAQVVHRQPAAYCLHAQPFGGVAYAEQRHAFVGGETQLRKVFRAVFLTVMGAHHAQTCLSALHGIVLMVNLELAHVHCFIWFLRTEFVI